MPHARTLFRRRAILATLGVGVGFPSLAFGQVVNINSNTIINGGDTTIGSPAVPLVTAQIIVNGVTLTINRTTPIQVASLDLRAAGGIGAVLTHTQGTKVDITTTGNLSVDANSVISADLKGHPGGQGPGSRQTGIGFNGGGAGFGGAGGDGGDTSQTVTTFSGLGGDCYAFDQTSLFGPTELGSGGGPVWVNGSPDTTSAGFGGGAIKLQVGGTLTLNGQISARGGNGSYRTSGTNRSGGGGSGGSIFIGANTIVGTGSIVAAGGNGGSGTFGIGGGGGGGRVSIITSSSNLDEISVPDLVGGTGSNRGGTGTYYRRLGGEVRGTVFIDSRNASPGENTEFYGPVTLDANLVVQNNGRLGPRHRLTDSDLGTFDLSVLGNVTVAGGVSPGGITADARGRRADSGTGAGVSQEFLNGGGAGYGGRGGSGGEFVNSGGATFGSVYSLLLGSGGASVWLAGVPDRTSGGFGGGVIKLQVGGTLTLNGQISARGGNGSYRTSGTNRSGGGGSGGSIFIGANTIVGTGSIVAAGGNGGSGTFGIGGGGGGGRVVVVTCSVNNPSVSLSGGTGAAPGQPGTSVVRRPGFFQQPVSRSVCPGSSITLQAASVGVGQATFQWRKGNSPINTAFNPSAATSALSLSNLSDADSGAYSCIVTYSCGGATSSESATVSVTIGGPADLASEGAALTPDGTLDNNDFVAFIQLFFDGDARADFGSDGAAPTPDGNFDNNDFIVFINAFFTGC